MKNKGFISRQSSTSVAASNLQQDKVANLFLYTLQLISNYIIYLLYIQLDMKQKAEDDLFKRISGASLTASTAGTRGSQLYSETDKARIKELM